LNATENFKFYEMKKIRILHYGLSSNMGGIEIYINELQKLIDKKSFQFDFLVTTFETPCFYKELLDSGSIFHRITPRKQSFLQNYNDLKEVFTSGNYDILHYHVNTLSYIQPVLIALQSGCKVIVHSHSAGASSNGITKFLHKVNSYRLVNRNVQRVSVSNLAGKWLFGNHSNFEIINNGIDTKRFRYDFVKRSELRNSLGLGNSFVIGHIGTFIKVKNHEFLLKIFERLKIKKPDAKLMLIGKGYLEPNIKRKVKMAGLSDSVLFLGRRTDIPELLSAMDVFVLPSLYEGLGMVLIEAQASGLHCFTSADVVPYEAKVTDLLDYIPLSKSVQEWAERILMFKDGYKRKNTQDDIIKAGYDIQDNAKWLENFYFDIM